MRRTCGLIMALGLGCGCANTAALETELSRLRRELHFVRQDLAKHKRTVEGLERRMTLVSLGKGQPIPAPIPEDTPAAVSMMDPGPARAEPPAPSGGVQPRRRALPVVRLGSNAQPKPVRQDDEWVDPGAQDDGGPPLQFKMEGETGENDRLTVDRSVLRARDPVLHNAKPASVESPAGRLPPAAPPPVRRSRASKTEVKNNYKAALARLRENKQPKVALQMFDAFLLAYPKSKFADNAAYWRGECLFALAKHEQAIAAFDALMRKHPRSPKVPFALIRKGESLLAVGRKPAAIQAFKRVTAEHATSEAAGTAKSLLAKHAK